MIVDLPAFIAGPSRNLWIRDSGLNYYVRKSHWYEGLIELASCSATRKSVGGMWVFLRKYSGTIPFKMEQVLNPQLAQYMRRIGWYEYMIGSTPQFYSPLAVARFSPRELEIDNATPSR